MALLEALDRRLAGFLPPAPADKWIDQFTTTAGGVAIGATEAVVCTLTVDRNTPFVLEGWATSPTALDVQWRVLVNGLEVVATLGQPSANLWTPAPLWLYFDRGPRTVEIRCVHPAGPYGATVFGRLRGYYPAGEVQPNPDRWL